MREEIKKSGIETSDHPMRQYHELWRTPHSACHAGSKWASTKVLGASHLGPDDELIRKSAKYHDRDLRIPLPEEKGQRHTGCTAFATRGLQGTMSSSALHVCMTYVHNFNVYILQMNN